MNNIKNDIDNRVKQLKLLSTVVEKKIKSFPPGNIKAKRHKKSVYYYLSNEEYVEKYLSSDDVQLLTDLLQKSYFQKVLRAAKTEKEYLKKVLETYPEPLVEDIFDQLPDARKLNVKPLVLSDEQYAEKWQESPFEPKKISDSTPVFLTMKGERVRSKSEMIIADRLNVNGIPYKYECPLLVGDEIIHPDFTILKVSERKILYLEHCGRMDDPDYVENMVSRATKYSLAGITAGTLFYTFETSKSPFDVRVIDKLIKTSFV